jgi:diguanylate cyclase (GGDEF)-like protein
MNRDSGSQASLRRAQPENGETSRFEAVLESGQGVEALDGDQTMSAPRRRSSDPGPEANLILIAHPASRSLGTRFRLKPHSTILIGRDPSAQISLPDVTTLSREHARLSYRNETVILEDLDSRNGTFVNEERIEEPRVLKSGDRFQVGAAHFKFLQGRDIENAYHQAIHDLVILDGLTEIANRRRFEEDMTREFGRAQRYGRPLSLILFDIDRFKLINDEHGHLCGDLVLKKIVELARPLMRREQVFARVGGEEFAILCPEGVPEQARILAERVRGRLAGYEFEHGGNHFGVTCSFGVAGISSALVTVEDLYEAADRALYRSKETGRNRVSVWQSTSPSGGRSDE